MTRDELIAAMRARAPKALPVDTPEWGGTTYVRAPTVADMGAGGVYDGDGADKLGMAVTMAQIICDEDGALLFDRSSRDDLELLASQPQPMLMRLLNAVTVETGVEAAKND